MVHLHVRLLGCLVGDWSGESFISVSVGVAGGTPRTSVSRIMLNDLLTQRPASEGGWKCIDGSFRVGTEWFTNKEVPRSKKKRR